MLCTTAPWFYWAVTASNRQTRCKLVAKKDADECQGLSSSCHDPLLIGWHQIFGLTLGLLWWDAPHIEFNAFPGEIVFCSEECVADISWASLTVFILLVLPCAGLVVSFIDSVCLVNQCVPDWPSKFLAGVIAISCSIENLKVNDTPSWYALCLFWFLQC